jgi:hypothetical protein
MEEIKAPKKEMKFLKAIGNIGKVLAEELVIGIARKFIGKTIDKVGNKKQGLVIAFIVLASSFVFAQFPSTGNKQRLGFQTTADGLVWRGSLSDTASIQPVSNQNAWVILDTVNLKIYSFDFTSNVWNQVGSGAFAQPIDSLFFKTSVPPNNVDTAKMRWDNELGTVVLGMYDNVPNELGFKNFWLVKNQTGSTITKNSLVYASGTVGSSGRISVSKFIANGTINAKYLLGITAHDLTDGEDGYVISFGKIRQVNTDTFAAGVILYPSPTVAGVWTDVEPIAPNLDMPIGFCINSSSNNGTIAIRVASGYKLSELHDLAISSPVTNASLYYSGGLWRDTTATLLVSDTAAMLANYATKAYADTSGRFYARQDFTNVSSSTLTWTQSDTLVVGGVNVVQVYRNGQILLPTQYTIPTNASVVIGATAYKVGENYTVIFPRGGGASSGGGSGSLTSISGGTGILVSPNPITTTGTVSADLSVLMELTDTSLLNLTSRFASKLNPSDTISLSNRIDTKGVGTVTSVGSGFGLLGGTITTTGTLRLDTTTIYARLQDSINVAIGNDTIKILKQEYQPALSSVLTWTITPKFPIQLKAYILVFRNGQLLNNDQYNLTDTNKITIVSTSFKVGANYTVATVSGIGSINTGVFPNPIYPDAGIALSTGSTWASSITNNSANWNTAFTDRLKWDGGSTDLVASTGRTSLGGTTIGQSMFTLSNPSSITFPRFNANNSVSSLTASEFRTAIGAGVGTVTSVIVASGTPLSINNNNTVPEISMAAASGSVNGYLSLTDWTTFNGKQNALGFTPANNTITINTNSPLQGGGNLTGDRTISILSASETQSGIVNTSSQLFGGSKVFKNRVTIDSVFTLNTTSSIPTQILGINTTGNVNSVGKFTLSNGLNITLGGTLQADTTFLFTQSDTLSLNLTSRFATKLNYTDTSFLFTQSDTNQLNLTNRFNLKANLNSPTFTGTVSGINKSMVGLGNVDNTSDANKPISSATQTALNLKQNTLTNPVTGTGTTNTLPLFTGASTLGNSIVQQSSNNIGINTTPFASLTLGQGKNIMLDASSNNVPRLLFYESFDRNENDVQFGAKIQYHSINDRLEFVMRDSFAGDPSGDELAISIVRQTGNVTIHKPTTLSSTLAVTGGTTLSNLSGVGDRMVVANSSGLLSTQTIPSGGGGTGTVTSVGLTTPSIFTVSGSPVTTSGTLALTYSGTALPLLNGGTGATTADGALTNLGATAQGKLLFGLTNSTSDKFIKVNTDNTITLLNAADTRTAIGAGVGTVTNVSGTGAISVSNNTTTPSISVASATFLTAGIVTATGTQQFGGDKVFEGITQFNGRAVFKDYTYQATRLAGLSSTDRLSTVTLGTGLTLSSGVLSASTGVTSVTASTPLASSGGATPNITITDAGASASGVVNTTTQSFAGNKTFTGTINVSSTGTFGGRVNTPWLERTYTSSTATSLTVSVNTTWLNIHQDATVTLTLPNAATYPGKELIIKQTGSGVVFSASSNIIGFTTAFNGSTQTAIINPVGSRFATLVSDGTNWIIMQRNN